MAGKFVELNDAAKMIGVSPEELVEMRSRGEIFGYRDGASWKFKLEEVERVIGERGSRIGTGESAILSANDDEFESLISGLSSKILAEKAQEESESVLVSEEELGLSATGQSTIIGKGKQPVEVAGDSDLKLAEEAPSKPASGTGSDKLLEAPGSKLNLGGESDVLGGSDLKVSGGSGTGDMPALAPKPGSTGDLQLGEKLSLGEEDDLELGSSDSALDEEIHPKKKGSGTGSGIGSDVTLGAGDSGINLSPTDSGLSLDEEPLDLVPGGSAVESLELPEDDEVISLEQASADPDQATQLKADQDFQLSPGTMEAVEDESDSGSQVIALEDSESFDQDAATMLKSEPGGPLAADAFQPMPGDSLAMGSSPGAMSMGGGQPVYVQVPVVEAPYSIWNVLSLMAITLMLALAAMMMVDVMLNMWSFSGSSSVTTGIMDMFTSTFSLDNR
ncbi:MAG TPA: helix-turn-helix domain-containing protein [Pirellulaceae bacterium]|nr:helix-turn-helix domain-containing protein [Pirellulaceae bacterium]